MMNSRNTLTVIQMPRRVIPWTKHSKNLKTTHLGRGNSEYIVYIKYIKSE